MDLAHARLVAQELQLTGRQAGVTFHGRSMEPLLRDGDGIDVEPVAWPDIRVGDVVTYRLDDRFPTLRVVRATGSKLVLRGDNWPFADFEAWPEDVLGRVAARRRGADVLTRSDLEWRWRTRAAIADDRLRRLKRRTLAEGRRIRGGVGRRIGRWISRRPDAPSSLQINVSASCNLGCRMCPYLDVHDDASYAREMTLETFQSLLPALRRLPSLHVAGSGEPFMNRNLIRFIELARAVNPGLEIGITTNGTLLVERTARELVRVKVNRLVVSIDGVSARTVGAIRIGINLEKVLANVRTLAAVKRETGSVWPVIRVNYMIGYGSYDELPDFLRIAKDIGASEVHVLEVLAGTEDAFRDNLLNNVARDGGRTLREAKKIADAAGVKLILPITQHDACLHPYSPHVSEAGAVSPCCYVDYEGRTFWKNGGMVRMPRIDYGNVRDKPFDAIWRSAEFAELRQRDRRGDFPDFCQTCQSIRAETSKAVHAVLD